MTIDMMHTMKIMSKVLFGVACIAVLSCCIGPAGPPGTDGLDGGDGMDGLAGRNGEDGADGADGIDGMDGNENCVICHNSSTDLFLKQQQFSLSDHDTIDYYQGTRTSCAACHSHEGFMIAQASGDPQLQQNLEFPMSINCRTCHLIHTNYDLNDYDLVTVSAVTLRLGDVEADFGPRSNICINCHQARTSSELPVLGGANVNITSTHWGIHHAPESNLILGYGGYEFSGSMSYPADGTNSHLDEGCVKCHMRTTNILAGGHTFSMLSEGNENYHACVECHSEIGVLESFDLGGIQSDIRTKMIELTTILQGKGWLDSEGNLIPVGDLSANDAGALLNYDIIDEDGSDGIHNPAYIQALLTNTLENITP